ncbi:flagellar motor protein MotB [Pseudoxanthomonas sp.]|uniref:flagellar motor protein MotB n=1 Tax=Pseudoxanthomonas sp. TaxID=1871049 RepID=UPI002602B000|nr:flagellar motor protein MotB [Pseudoxanthomonas sp.]WDS34709.1 MAG: flagellar motor protein MotB [Pseudoxanthomonas sp.]
MADGKSTVIIRRVRKVQGRGHHGGAWKVAFADFVTAMMAFFLVMWLMAATTKQERMAISEYFRNPSPLAGKSPAPAPGLNGPGGASSSMIKLGGSMDLTKGSRDVPFGHSKGQAATAAEQDQRAQEKRRLESLMKELQEAISKSQALEPFKDQLLLDLTPEGLRIQIVDKQNRPMFDQGSAHLKDYTIAILHELASFINQVPNHISITGHTDTTAYSNDAGYTNWELSADRANAARRALIGGGMEGTRVTRVVGLSSSVLFDKTNPQNPINRRISIVVMTHDAEAAALAGSGQAVALSKPLPDADTHVPDLGTTPAAADTGHASAAPAHAAGSTPPSVPAGARTPLQTSTGAQVVTAVKLARAAEAAISHDAPVARSPAAPAQADAAK